MYVVDGRSNNCWAARGRCTLVGTGDTSYEVNVVNSAQTCKDRQTNVYFIISCSGCLCRSDPGSTLNILITGYLITCFCTIIYAINFRKTLGILNSYVCNLSRQWDTPQHGVT